MAFCLHKPQAFLQIPNACYMWSNVLQLHVLSHVCLLPVSVKQGLSHTDLLICVYSVGGSRAAFDKYLLELCCEVSGHKT